MGSAITMKVKRCCVHIAPYTQTKDNTFVVLLFHPVSQQLVGKLWEKQSNLEPSNAAGAYFCCPWGQERPDGHAEGAEKWGNGFDSSVYHLPPALSYRFDWRSARRCSCLDWKPQREAAAQSPCAQVRSQSLSPAAHRDTGSHDQAGVLWTSRPYGR